MGKALPTGVGASGAPSVAGKPWTNSVVEGTITAAGPTTPFAFYGAFNLAIWGQINTTLTTTAGSAKATVASATGIVVGQTVISVNVPQGATIKTIESTVTVNLGGLSSTQIAAIPAGADTAALFEHAVPEATVRLERSFDGGVTWVTCGVGGAGAAASYALGAAGITTPISLVVAEPEQQVAYRLNCTVYTSGTINYRFSASGLAALSWGIPVG